MQDKDKAPDALAAEIATGLRSLASFVEGNPQFADMLRYSFGGMNAFCDDPAVLAEFLLAGKRLGAEATKSAAKGSEWFIAELRWGRVGIDLNAHREEVCERIVTGTREVTEQVPDPALLAEVPMVQQTRTEEIIEWQCRPLLAGGVKAEQADK